MDTTMDLAIQLARLATAYEATAQHLSDLERRMRRLEHWAYAVIGGAGVLGTLVGWLLGH